MSCETGWRLNRKQLCFSKWWNRLIWYYHPSPITYHVFMHGIFFMWDRDPTFCCRILMATTRFRLRGQLWDQLKERSWGQWGKTINFFLSGILPGLKTTAGSLGEEILSEVLDFFLIFCFLLEHLGISLLLALEQHPSWMKKRCFKATFPVFLEEFRILERWKRWRFRNHHLIQGNHHGIQGNHHETHEKYPHFFCSLWFYWFYRWKTGFSPPPKVRNRLLRQPVMEALWQGDVGSRASAWKALLLADITLQGSSEDYATRFV